MRRREVWDVFAKIIVPVHQARAATVRDNLGITGRGILCACRDSKVSQQIYLKFYIDKSVPHFLLNVIGIVSSCILIARGYIIIWLLVIWYGCCHLF